MSIFLEKYSCRQMTIFGALMAPFVFIVSIFSPHNHYGVIGIFNFRPYCEHIPGEIQLSSNDNLRGLDGVTCVHCQHLVCHLIIIRVLLVCLFQFQALL